MFSVIFFRKLRRKEKKRRRKLVKIETEMIEKTDTSEDIVNIMLGVESWIDDQNAIVQDQRNAKTEIVTAKAVVHINQGNVFYIFPIISKK